MTESQVKRFIYTLYKLYSNQIGVKIELTKKGKENSEEEKIKTMD